MRQKKKVLGCLWMAVMSMGFAEKRVNTGYSETSDKPITYGDVK